MAWGINNKERVTVAWGDSAGNTEGAIYNGKKYQTIDVPDAVNSVPHAIKTAGDIAFAWFCRA